MGRDEQNKLGELKEQARYEADYGHKKPQSKAEAGSGEAAEEVDEHAGQFAMVHADGGK